MPDFDKEDARKLIIEMLKSGEVSSHLIRIFKEAIKEWLDERSADLGWFCMRWLGRVAFVVIVLLAVKLDIK